MKKSDSLKKFLHHLFNYKISIICICIFCIFISLFNILSPIYVGKTIDNIIQKESALFSKNILIIVLIYILLFITNICLYKLLTKFCSKICYDLRKKLFTKINNAKVSFVENNNLGSILNNFSIDIENIHTGLLGFFNKSIIGISSIILSIILMLKINYQLCLILILSGPAMYLLSRFITKKTSKFFNKKSEALTNLSSYSNEIFSNSRLVRNFNYTNTVTKNFEDLNYKTYKIGLKSHFYSSLTNPSTRFVSNISYIIVGAVGCFFAIYGKITVGSISTFLMYTNIFTKPFNEITALISDLLACNSSIIRIFEFLEKDSEEVINNSLIKNIDIKGKIDFKNVEFSYTDTPFIKNLNLSVSPKENIAIVGKTGAGKTTLVNLIMKFYEIKSGKILIDDIDINDYNTDFLRKNIGMVLQDTKLFIGTVKENIAYGKPEATDEEIISVAKMAHAHDFIMRLPNGYDTIISNENLLSKGEIQLITIARIMLLNPPIIILDEATSNIDLITENIIQKNFFKLINNSTSFIIAHRLSTIKHADKIIFIENGNIVEQGTHEELLKQKGKYYELYMSQYNI